MWVPVVVRPGCITLLNRYTAFTYFATCSDRRIVNVCVMMQLAADGEHWWVSWEKRIHVADGVWEPLPRPHRRCQGTAAEKVCCSLPSLVMVIQRWMWPAFIHVLAAQQLLRLAASHQLTVLLHRRVTYGGRTFAVTVPSTWNSLLKSLCDPSNSASVFGRLLITFFFSEF